MVKTIWQDFELECTDYLNDKFGAFAYFEHQGGSDSTVADIKVETRGGKIFYYINILKKPLS